MTQPPENAALVLQPDQLPAIPVYEDPTVILDRAIKWANALMKIVTEKGMFAAIHEKQYLEVEAWQLVAMFSRSYAIPREPVPMLNGDGDLVGYQCTTDLYQNGIIIGSGTSSCGLDAFSTKDREGSDQHKAAKSTAQTWSISRAIKNSYGFVAKLAGFETTPADEMRAVGGLTTDPMMVCPLHDVEWFKRGRMKEFAHVVDGEKGPRGGDKWCNQEEVIANLADRIKVVMRKEEWETARVEEWGKLWPAWSPAERLKRLLLLEEPASLQDGPEPNIDEPYAQEPTPTPPGNAEYQQWEADEAQRQQAEREGA